MIEAKTQWKTYVGLIVVLIGIGILTAVAIKAIQNKPADESVREIKPVFGNIESFISTPGVVEPQNRLEIKPPISGRVEEILVEEGEKVDVGHVLAWMSSTERAALLDSARVGGETNLKDWQEVYKPTPLLAPINGEVIVRAVEPGQTVTSSDAVLVLSDRLIVKAQVDETDIGKVKLHQRVTITLDAYSDIQVKGFVDHISYESKVINNITIYEVDVLPDSIPDVFRSGMSATIDIRTIVRENILIIPKEAVKREKGEAFVLVRPKKNHQAVRRVVELGVSDTNNIEVISGLDAEGTVLIKTNKYIPPNKKKHKRNPFSAFRRKK